MPDLTLTLPYPPKVLNPNGRTRQRNYLYAERKRFKGDAMASALGAGAATCGIGSGVIHAHWFHPQKRLAMIYMTHQKEAT